MVKIDSKKGDHRYIKKFRPEDRRHTPSYLKKFKVSFGHLGPLLIVIAGPPTPSRPFKYETKGGDVLFWRETSPLHIVGISFSFPSPNIYFVLKVYKI